MPSPLQIYLPWTSLPLIINAPMAGFAGGRLASGVTLAGGLGMIGSLFSMEDLRKEIAIAKEALSSSLDSSKPSTLPIGIGFLPFVLKLEDVLPVIEEHRPAVAWLFAAKSLDDYNTWAHAIRKSSPETKIWIQTGSVKDAHYLAQHVQPDALCLQGADAGGHGYEKGAGIISLLPETDDTLKREGYGGIPIIASGGIVDGRGIAAALTLGAQAVVMGTRFLASEEVTIHPAYQASILEAQDGGQITTRSKLFDQLRGPNPWPVEYDGRSLLVKSHKDFVQGTSLEEIQKSHNEAVQLEDKGYKTGLEGRAAIWAGTGVGLVSEIESAGKIVGRVRDDAVDVLRKAAARL